MNLSMLVGPEAAALSGGDEIDIAGLTADSREVRPGWLFAALRGAKADGGRFVADAVAKGAAAGLIQEG
jgi:UDP-N-acetylmuramoyl-L-alanyl-D-glutamate--2,6-diaminopimelate ligase